MPKTITKQRAEKVAKAHACVHCGEYSYKKLSLKLAAASHQKEFGEVWHCVKICGICDVEQELGIDGEGEIVYAG